MSIALRLLVNVGFSGGLGCVRPLILQRPPHPIGIKMTTPQMFIVM